MKGKSSGRLRKNVAQALSLCTNPAAGALLPWRQSYRLHCLAGFHILLAVWWKNSALALFSKLLETGKEKRGFEITST
jgi:hypothetical protein